MNFEEISRKLVKFSKDTVTEIQKMNEVHQLNTRVNGEKKRINQLYREMGKKLYDLYRDAPLEGFEKEIEEIEEKFRMMDLLRDQIRTVKGVVLCPCCNMEVDAAERYCSNCGNKMPEVFTVEDAVVLEEDETAAEDVAEEVAETEETAENVTEAAEKVTETEETAENAAEETAETEEAAAEVEIAAEESTEAE